MQSYYTDLSPRKASNYIILFTIYKLFIAYIFIFMFA